MMPQDVLAADDVDVESFDATVDALWVRLAMVVRDGCNKDAVTLTSLSDALR